MAKPTLPRFSIFKQLGEIKNKLKTNIPGQLVAYQVESSGIQEATFSFKFDEYGFETRSLRLKLKDLAS